MTFKIVDPSSASIPALPHKNALNALSLGAELFLTTVKISQAKALILPISRSAGQINVHVDVIYEVDT